MFKILLFTLILTLLSLAEGPVLKTGQTTSYVEFDDGYYQAGKARRYSRSGDVVRDNATGLEWQDNETVAKRWLTKENYDAGNYEDTLGETATTYCANLPLDGGGWRLPMIEELETLVDGGKYNPSVTENVFQDIIPGYYWSSTTAANNTSYAWSVHFNSGDSDNRSKRFSNYVRCVRGGQLETSSFSRDYVTEIVTDWATGLQWQDNEIVKTTENWSEAIDYCENTLTLGGHNDWRLPNINELLSIADRSRYNPSLDMGTFEHVSSYRYWSSTTSALYVPSAWDVDFFYGYLSNGHSKGDSYCVRCVRGGQFDNSALPPVIMYLLD